MANDRWLIVGLGNPGPAYAHNRHNVGYWCINRLARLHGVPLKARRLYALGEGRIAARPAILLKPRTYMNRSGHAVSALLKHAGISPQRMLVICDELDLPPGKLRLRPSGNHGGHNGLRSIISTIGSQDFPRLRIGVGRPLSDGQPTWDPDLVAGWLLSDPPADAVRVLQEAVAQAAEAVQSLLSEGLEEAMNRYNR